MTHELTTMWQTIHNTLPHIQEAINGSTPPPDGMPGTPSNPRRLPCNEHALSLKEQITRRAAHWTGEPNATKWLSQYASILFDRLGMEDALSFQTETHTLHTETQQYQPAHALTRHLTGQSLDRIHVLTIAHLAQYLTAITGKPHNPSTLRTWKERGHITHTSNGYSLQEAHAHATRQ